MSNNKKIEYDKVMSFQFDDLPIRGRICQTSRSLNKIISQHNYPPEISKLLGETIVLNILMADSIKLKHKLSLQVHGNKDLKLIVNSSRSIIYASNNSDFAQKAQNEAMKIQMEMEKYLKNI